MKKIIALLTATLVLMAVVSVGPVTGDEKTTVLYKHSDLIGKAFKNKTGDHLGYLEDVVIDIPSGGVVFAVLSTKNTLGVGGQLYALPPSACSVSGDGTYIILDVPKNEFESVAGFDANSWPDRPNERWTKLAQRKGPAPTKDAKLARLTSLVGLPVKNNSGETLGKVHAFPLDCGNDRIPYAVMSHGGVAGVGTKYFAIPWKAMDVKTLNLRPQDRAFVLNANRDDFEKAPGFDYKNWPIQGEERFMKNAPKTR